MSVRPPPSHSTPAVGQPPLEIRLLGPLEVRRGGEIVALGGARPRALLALLCVHRGAVVSTDRIIEELWGGSPPATARHMVEVYVSKLRKLLGPGAIHTRAPGYVVDGLSERLDIPRFERLLAEGQDALAAGEPSLAASRLSTAIGLWRGAALLDFAYEPFAQDEIARLEELRSIAEEEWIEAGLALGQAEELIDRLERLVAKTPFRERPRRQLMLALYRAGRQADALAVYRIGRDVLVEELGIEPGVELRRLERAILAQEEWLDVGDGDHQKAPARVEEIRKIVTVLSIDFPVEDEHRDEDPEEFRLAAGRSVRRVRETVMKHGAHLEELPDGTVMGVFGSPKAHEDDALRAVRVADELRRLGLLARAGVETGEVLTAHGTPLTGAVLRSAARLREAARRSEVLVGETARRLLREGVELEAVESNDPRAWRLLHVSSDRSPRSLRLDAPFVGREGELNELRDVFDKVVAERTARRVIVVGEPGIGKSRLARELAETLADEARVLLGRCLAYGDGITYWPLREVLRQVAPAKRLDELVSLLGECPDAVPVAARLGGVLGLTESLYPVEEISWAARRFFEALADERPLLLVFDDVHWAEATFLELTENLADSRRHDPILILYLARPELLDAYPHFDANTLHLGPLDADAGENLATELSARLGVDASVQGQIAEAAQGNPLFLEQLVAHVHETPGAFLDHLDVPPTLQALLAARLDTLGTGERAVAECAAVVGREFWTGAVAELVAPEGRPALSRHLAGLARRGFIVPDASRIAFEQSFRFRHVLIQDAVYRSVPKQRRAELHEQLGDWIERKPENGNGEKDGLVGFHLEQACRYRADLSAFEPGCELATRAAQHLAAAGRKASRSGDVSAATNLLSRAAALLLTGDPTRLELLPTLGMVFFEAGALVPAEATLTQALEESVQAADERIELRARLELLALRAFTTVEPMIGELGRAAREAVPVFEEFRDEASLARAWQLVGYGDLWVFRGDSGQEAFERALVHARNAGDTRAEGDIVLWLGRALVLGSSPVPVAIQRCDALRGGVSDRRIVDAGVLEALAALHAMQGDFAAARELCGEARQIYADLGQKIRLASLSAAAARVELLAGDREAAERALRQAHDALTEMGERGLLSTIAANLAHLVCEQGRLDEAAGLIRVSEEASSADDLGTHARSKTARAKLLVRQGRLPEAERLAREAAALMEDTQFPNGRGDALMDLSEVLRLTGRARDATSAVKQALHLYETKGNLASAARARKALVSA